MSTAIVRIEKNARTGESASSSWSVKMNALNGKSATRAASGHAVIAVSRLIVPNGSSITQSLSAALPAAATNRTRIRRLPSSLR
jgi:hypothetical protein